MSGRISPPIKVGVAFHLIYVQYTLLKVILHHKFSLRKCESVLQITHPMHSINVHLA